MTQLKIRAVDKIEGKFFVPSYQRGYRWTEKEVRRLLDDVYNLEKDLKYCLQPIVVKNLGENNFEVIDGQQRLTTLFLIYNYMYETIPPIGAPKFSLRYETREKSESFLKKIDVTLKDENIDFHFITNAYENIKTWFAETGELFLVMTKVKTLFANSINIIWYEVDNSADGAALFTRLNIGKIPLTNAELVKAMFLSRSNPNIDANKQQEIALQWDSLEKELHNDSFWYFLTNSSPENYQTRIDLILDLIAGKNINDRDNYATFFYFDKLRGTKNLDEVWLEIRKTFLLLKDWYEYHEFYHKIGYLIASGYKNLAEIYRESRGKTTGEFSRRLKEIICDSIKLGDDETYSDWNYDDNKEKIRRLLLLFNVESVRQNSQSAYWFPFDKFKFVDEQRAAWSLEHIHAVHSEEKGKQENWRDWLELHKKSLENVEDDNSELIAEIEKLLKLKEINYDRDFKPLQEKILAKFAPADSNDDYINSISNLALIKCAENSALSNSTFDVKRNSIIEMDMRGEFIPFCTKMAFLKYYTKSEKNQLHFWSQVDRNAYIAAINTTLAEYLAQQI